MAEVKRRGGLTVLDSNVQSQQSIKSKPLQNASNTIDNLKQGLNSTTRKQPVTQKQPDTQKKPTIHKKPTVQKQPKKTVDENTEQFVPDSSYDPLSEIYSLDEELYQKVLKLELADDGLPVFVSNEPFDF